MGPTSKKIQTMMWLESWVISLVVLAVIWEYLLALRQNAYTWLLHLVTWASLKPGTLAPKKKWMHRRSSGHYTIFYTLSLTISLQLQSQVHPESRSNTSKWEEYHSYIVQIACVIFVFFAVLGIKLMGLQFAK